MVIDRGCVCPSRAHELAELSVVVVVRVAVAFPYRMPPAGRLVAVVEQPELRLFKFTENEADSVFEVPAANRGGVK